MRKTCAALGMGILCTAFVALGQVGAASHEDAASEAMHALDEFMEAFNARDPQAWATTLNYPHVRIAGGSVRVWETEAEFADYMDFDAFAARFGWDHSVWDSREVVQAGKDKVHVVVRFSRYNVENKKIATYDSLYIVTRMDGHWGTQARSSFAP